MRRGFKGGFERVKGESGTLKYLSAATLRKGELIRELFRKIELKKAFVLFAIFPGENNADQPRKNSLELFFKQVHEFNC